MISRPEAFKICEAESVKINNNLIKCLAYKNSTNDYSKWLQDLSESLDTLNQITIANQGKKLRKFDLDNHVFYIFGTKLSDAEKNLKQFHLDKDTSLPYFLITFELVKSLYALYSEFKETFIEIIRKPNKSGIHDFYNKLMEMLEKYVR